MKGRIAVVVAVSLSAMTSCGHDQSTTTEAPSPVPVAHSTRSELAFFTTHGSAVYDLAVPGERGRHLRTLTGESIKGTVVPALFTGISWSPDGSQVAFAGGHGQQEGGAGEVTEIYVMNADGSEARPITNVGDASTPMWSTDGSRIVFTRLHFDRNAPLRGDLYSVATDGSNLTQIAQASDWQTYRAGSFSPDGSQLAVTRTSLDPRTGSSSSTINVLDTDGSDERQLIADASDPAFSPDGRRIAFVSGRDHNGRLCYGDRCFAAGELYVANSDGSAAQRLTRTNALNEAHPSWSPDGSRIAYQRGEVFQNAEAMSVIETNAAGGCTRTVLAGSGPGPWYADPAWRPTSAQVEFGPLSCGGRSQRQSSRGDESASTARPLTARELLRGVPLRASDRRAFISSADTVCRRVNQQSAPDVHGAARLGKRVTTLSAAERRRLAGFYEYSANAGRAEVTALRALVPPPADRSLISRYLSIQKRLPAALEDEARALIRGPVTASHETHFGHRLLAADGAAAQIGQRYGFRWCRHET